MTPETDREKSLKSMHSLLKRRGLTPKARAADLTDFARAVAPEDHRLLAKASMLATIARQRTNSAP